MEVLVDTAVVQLAANTYELLMNEHDFILDDHQSYSLETNETQNERRVSWLFHVISDSDVSQNLWDKPFPLET